MLKSDNLAILNLDFIEKQLEASFSKIKIVNDSIDKIRLQWELISYYRKKHSGSEENTTQYSFIDLFCGAGGLSIGLEQEGLYPVMAIDKDESAMLTYRFNRPWLTSESIINDDIRPLVKEDIFPHVPLIVGGPPCQGFSVVNKHKKENDERNELYKFYVHAVDQSQPDIFLMENVKGILRLYGDIEKDFKKIGYLTCSPILCNTKDFGFPQNRKRVFILGINKKYRKISKELYQIFIDTIHSHLGEYAFTLGDAIQDLPALNAKTRKNATYFESANWGYTFGKFHTARTDYARLVNRGLPEKLPLLNHRSKYNNDRDIRIYELLKPGEKSDAESIQELNPYKSRADIFRDKFDKLRLDEPCKAITAHMYYDCNMYIHPTQARGLSPREAARVQGFPDDYLFLGSPNEWYRQIGNAVSPLMARVLGEGLKKVLERINKV